MAIGLTVAELERRRTNMNTKEKHIIRSILNCFPSFSLADFGEYFSLTQFCVKFDNVKALTMGTPSSC